MPSLSRLKAAFLVGFFLLVFLNRCGGPAPKPTANPTSVATLQATEISRPEPSPTAAGLPREKAPAPPPRVIEQRPAPMEEAPVNASFEIVFNQPMDTERTAGAWLVNGPDGKAIPGRVSWPETAQDGASSGGASLGVGKNRVLRFTPQGVLQPGAVYAARLEKEAASQAGASLPEALSFTFQTVGPLQVSQVSPAAGSQEVSGDALFTVIFNHPVVPLLVAEDQAALPQPLEITPAVVGRGEWLNTSVYVFRSEKPLPGGQAFTATVKAGLADTQGGQLAADYQWKFTTLAPTVEALNLPNFFSQPPPDLGDVPLDQPFQLVFRQPMDRPSVQAAFSVAAQAGQPVEFRSAWNDLSTQVVFTPTQLLEPGARYLLRLDASARSVDGSSLQQGVEWRFTSVPRPAILGFSAKDGEVLKSALDSFQIDFASPMKYSSLAGKISLTPQPEGGLKFYYWEKSLVIFGLKPSTTYVLTIQPGLEDRYGYRIEKSYRIRFTNGPALPSAYLLMPQTPALLRADGQPSFYVSYINVKSVKFTLYRLSLREYNTLVTEGSLLDYVPVEPVREWEQPSTEKPDQRARQSIQLEDTGGGQLPPGLYFLALDSPEVTHLSHWLDARILILSTANLTLKTTTGEALFWLTDLESGAPRQGATVRAYDDSLNEIGQGVTDGDGLAWLGDLAGQGPVRYAVAEEGGATLAFTSRDWESSLSLYDLGISTDYFARPDQPTAYLYTDRPIYRPGQTVYFKGIVRLNDDLHYHLPDEREAWVSITSYDSTVYSQTASLSEMGTFEGELKLDEGAALGGYFINMMYKKGEPFAGVAFTVAEYRKPEFQVSVRAAPGDVQAGESFSATVEADFYSGGAVANAKVSWTLTAQKYFFQPSDKSPELLRYSFLDYDRDIYFYHGPDFYATRVVAQGEGTTGEDGRLHLDLPAEAGEGGESQLLTLEATVTDLTGNAVSDRAQVVAHRSAYYPGIRSESYVGQAGKEQTLEVVVVDWASRPVAGQAVNVEIVERRWNSVQEEDNEGRLVWKSTVEDIPAGSFEGVMTNASGKAQVRFVPPNGGVYRARVTARDARGREGSASTYLWVAGVDYVPWRQESSHSFELVADRPSYRPGDTAEILIASPFEGEHYALVTVERGHLIKREVIQLATNSTVYRLPITADMAPNIFLSVVVIQGASQASRPDFKFGMAALQVSREGQELKVEVTPARTEAGPGEAVTYTVRTLDSSGQPVSAEVSLALVDLSVLSLTGPNTIPMLDYFYSTRFLSVLTSVPLALSLEEFNAQLAENPSQLPLGSGGGKGGEGTLGVIDVRENFPDTAFWTARILTGENGTASVTVRLPDNLTTWRMDARAVTLDTRTGQGTSDLVSTKPLLVRPQTPRFFVAGDRAWLSAAIHNNTGQDLAVEAALDAGRTSSPGVALSDPMTQTVMIPSGTQAVVGWWATVDPQAERVDLVFRARGGAWSDASRPALGTLEGGGIPVYRYESVETVATAGSLSEAGARSEAIGLPLFTGAPVTQGELVVKISPSLAAGMTDGLSYLEHYPFECTEQTVSRFLPNVITTRAMKEAGVSDPALEVGLAEQVGIALQRLYNSQHADGGWGWWGEGKSDPQVSAYVVLGLVEAGRSGYAVSPGVLERGLGFLRGSLEPVRSLEAGTLLNRQAFLLWVLARAGQPDPSRAAQLYEVRQGLSLYALGYLAQTLHSIRADDARLKTVSADFVSRAGLSASGAHWEEKDGGDPWNWNTDLRTTAIVLDTLVQIDPGSALNENAVRWLMANRTQGRWGGTQETAWTLMALTDWAAARGEFNASYGYEARLNEAILAGGQVDQNNLKAQAEVRINVAELLKEGLNQLTFARSAGPGTLYYTAHLSLALPVEQITALSRGITLSRQYFHLGERKQGAKPITEIAPGEMFLVRLTVVAPHDLHYLVVEDPLPAGVEAVDQSLRTSQQIVPEGEAQPSPEPGFWVPDPWGLESWGWWFFDHVERRDEKVVLSASYLPAGTYEYTYLVRAAIPGEYRVMPPTAYEFYFPEVYGRGEGSVFSVIP